ncbi:hypothetical protein BN1708_020124, partial [Verticillium longisporum]
HPRRPHRPGPAGEADCRRLQVPRPRGPPPQRRDRPRGPGPQGARLDPDRPLPPHGRLERHHPERHPGGRPRCRGARDEARRLHTAAKGAAGTRGRRHDGH